MGKEVKIGLGIIAVLLCVFAAVLVVRLRADKPSVATNDGAKEESDDKKAKGTEGAPGAKSQTKPRATLSSGPSQPTKIAASKEPPRPGAKDGGPSSEGDRWSRSSRAGNGPDPRENYMPNTGSPSGDDRYGRRHAGPVQAVASGAAAPATHNRFAAAEGDLANPPDETDDLALEPPEDEDDGDLGGAAMVSDDSSAPADDSQFDPFHGRRGAQAPPAAAALGDPAADSRSEVQFTDEPRRDRYRRPDPIDEPPPAANDSREVRDTARDRFRASDPVDENPLVDIRDAAPPVAAPRATRPAAAPTRFAAEIEPAELAHAPQAETYVVEPNDNYWTISRKVYGSGSWFKALQHHNSDQYPNADVLSVGDIVSTPELTELERAYPQLCPKRRSAPSARPRAITASDRGPRASGRTYAVRKGDTLFDIARHELGKASRWAEIYDLNRDRLGQDFDYLAPGTELLLPDDGQDAPLTARPPKPPLR